MRDVETSKKIELDGYVYLINHPQVEEAWDIGVELSKLIAVPAANMAMVKDDASLGNALSAAVNGLMQKIDGKSSMLLIRRILNNVECQGEAGGNPKKTLLDKAGINTHFHARPGAMMRLVGEVIVFTHKDFFESVKGMLSKLME
jgi:hypothetical protein